jgi:hypothetical protein
MSKKGWAQFKKKTSWQEQTLHRDREIDQLPESRFLLGLGEGEGELGGRDRRRIFAAKKDRCPLISVRCEERGKGKGKDRCV